MNTSVSEDLLSEWREVQHEIASKTIVLPDDEEATFTSFGNSQHGEYSYVCYEPSDIKDRLIGGVDVSFGKDDCAVAVYVVTQNLRVVYTDTLTYTLSQPYVSSYLAFREIEPLTDLIQRQMQNCPNLTPEVILVDGNGVWHERGAGIACFVGVKTGIATVGVGKTPYCCDGWNVDWMEGWISSSVGGFVDQCCCHHHQETEIELNTVTNGKDNKGKGGGDDDGDDCDNLTQSRSNNDVIVQCSAAMDAGSCSAFFRNNDTIQDKNGKMKMKDNVTTMSSYCMGYAITFKGGNGRILGAALVGHGGGGRDGKHKPSHKDEQRRQLRRQTQAGTKVPIYVSIGHAISLQSAVALCVALSIHRIPEPVRQADLIGRQIMRGVSV